MDLWKRGAPGNGGASNVDTAIMMLPSAPHSTRFDLDAWLLNCLYKPCTVHDIQGDGISVLNIVPEHGLDSGRVQRRSMPSSRMTSLAGSFDNLSALTDLLDRKYIFTECSNCYFLHDAYKIVFIVDLSPSEYSFDPDTDTIQANAALDALQKCLRGISLPARVPCLASTPDFEFLPKIYVSVLAYNPRWELLPQIQQNGTAFGFFRVLTHAQLVGKSDVPRIMAEVRKGIAELEASMHPHGRPAPQASSEDSDSEEEFEDSDLAGPRDAEQRLHSPDYGTYRLFLPPETSRVEVSLVHWLQMGDHVLRLLPEDCAPSLVFLTDGVLRSNFSISEAIGHISALTSSDTKFSVIQIGSSSGFSVRAEFGYPTDNGLLRFIAAALAGRMVYASDLPDRVPDDLLNFYHKCLLVRERRFRRDVLQGRYGSVHVGPMRISDVPLERTIMPQQDTWESVRITNGMFPWDVSSPPPRVEVMTMRYAEYNLFFGLGLIIEQRLLEGFTVRSVSVKHTGTSTITKTVLELAWHQNVTIQYIVTSHYVREDKDPAEPCSREATPPSDADTEDKISRVFDPVSSGLAGKAGNSLGEDDDDDDGDDDDGDGGYESPLKYGRLQSIENNVRVNVCGYLLFVHMFVDKGQVRQGDKILPAERKVKELQTFLTLLRQRDRLMEKLYDPTYSFGISRLYPVFGAAVGEDALSLGRDPRFQKRVASMIGVQPLPEVRARIQHWSELWVRTCEWLFGVVRYLYEREAGLSMQIFGYRDTITALITPSAFTAFMDRLRIGFMRNAAIRIAHMFRDSYFQGEWISWGSTYFRFLSYSHSLHKNTPAFVVARFEGASDWTIRIVLDFYNTNQYGRGKVISGLSDHLNKFRSHAAGRLNVYSPLHLTRWPFNLLPVTNLELDSATYNVMGVGGIKSLLVNYVEWRWEYKPYLGCTGINTSNPETRRSALELLRRIAMCVYRKRLAENFSIVYTSQPVWNTPTAHAAGMAESIAVAGVEREHEITDTVSFYQEFQTKGSNGVVGCHYTIIIDIENMCVRTKVWSEPKSAFCYQVFYYDTQLVVPTTTFFKILRPSWDVAVKFVNWRLNSPVKPDTFSPMSVTKKARFMVRQLRIPIFASRQPLLRPGTYPRGRLYGGRYPIENLLLDHHSAYLVEKHVLLGTTPTTTGSQESAAAAAASAFAPSIKSHYDYYRLFEHNPLIASKILPPTHPTQITQFTASWLGNGDFSLVTFRCFLEDALFDYCDAISVPVEMFHSTYSCQRLMSELLLVNRRLKVIQDQQSNPVRSPMFDKWYVKWLSNKTGFLYIAFPSTTSTIYEGAAGSEARRPNRPSSQAAGDASSSGRPSRPPSVHGSSSPHMRPRFAANGSASPRVMGRTLGEDGEPELDTASEGGDEGLYMREIEGGPPPGGETQGVGAGSEGRQSDFAPSPSIRTGHRSDRRGVAGSGSGRQEPPLDLLRLPNLQGYTQVFECTFESLDQRIKLITPPPNGRSEDEDIHLQKMSHPRDRYDDGLAYTGCFAAHENAQPFSTEAYHEIKVLESLYNRAFIQSVYLGLLMDRGPSATDIRLALGSSLMRKSALSVDATDLLRSLDLVMSSPSHGSHNERLCAAFEAFMSDGFGMVVVGHEDDHYYYMRANTPDSSSSLDLIRHAMSPLYVNFQFTVRQYDLESDPEGGECAGDVAEEAFQKLNLMGMAPLGDRSISLTELAQMTGLRCLPEGGTDATHNIRATLDVNVLYYNHQGQSVMDSSSRSGLAVPQVGQRLPSIPEHGPAADADVLDCSACGMSDAQRCAVKSLYARLGDFVNVCTMNALFEVAHLSESILDYVWGIIEDSAEQAAGTDAMQFYSDIIEITLPQVKFDNEFLTHGLLEEVMRRLTGAERGGIHLFQEAEYVYARALLSGEGQVICNFMHLSNTPSLEASRPHLNCFEGSSDSADATPFWAILKPDYSSLSVCYVMYSPRGLHWEGLSQTLLNLRDLIDKTITTVITGCLVDILKHQRQFIPYLVPPELGGFVQIDPCEQQLTLQDRQSGHQLQQQQQQQQQQNADAVKFIACLDPTGTQSRSRPQTPAHHYHSHYCHSNYAAPKAFEHRFYINSRNKTQAPNLVILDRVFQGRRIHGKYEMFVEDDDGNPVYGFLTCGHSLVEAPVSRHVTPRTSAMFDVPKKPNHDQHADHVAGTDQGVLSEQPEEPQSRNSNTNSPYAGSRADLPMIHSEVYLPKVGYATSVVSAPHTPLLNTASLSVSRSHTVSSTLGTATMSTFPTREEWQPHRPTNVPLSTRSSKESSPRIAAAGHESRPFGTTSPRKSRNSTMQRRRNHQSIFTSAVSDIAGSPLTATSSAAAAAAAHLAELPVSAAATPQIQNYSQTATNSSLHRTPSASNVTVHAGLRVAMSPRYHGLLTPNLNMQFLGAGFEQFPAAQTAEMPRTASVHQSASTHSSTNPSLAHSKIGTGLSTTQLSCMVDRSLPTPQFLTLHVYSITDISEKLKRRLITTISAAIDTYLTMPLVKSLLQRGNKLYESEMAFLFPSNFPDCLRTKPWILPLHIPKFVKDVRAFLQCFKQELLKRFNIMPHNDYLLPALQRCSDALTRETTRPIDIAELLEGSDFSFDDFTFIFNYRPFTFTESELGTFGDGLTSAVVCPVDLDGKICYGADVIPINSSDTGNLSATLDSITQFVDDPGPPVVQPDERARFPLPSDSALEDCRRGHGKAVVAVSILPVDKVKKNRIIKFVTESWPRALVKYLLDHVVVPCLAHLAADAVDHMVFKSGASPSPPVYMPVLASGRAIMPNWVSDYISTSSLLIPWNDMWGRHRLEEEEEPKGGADEEPASSLALRWMLRTMKSLASRADHSNAICSAVIPVTYNAESDAKLVFDLERVISGLCAEFVVTTHKFASEVASKSPLLSSPSPSSLSLPSTEAERPTELDQLSQSAQPSNVKGLWMDSCCIVGMLQHSVTPRPSIDVNNVPAAADPRKAGHHMAMHHRQQQSVAGLTGLGLETDLHPLGDLHRMVVTVPPTATHRVEPGGDQGAPRFGSPALPSYHSEANLRGEEAGGHHQLPPSAHIPPRTIRVHHGHASAAPKHTPADATGSADSQGQVLLHHAVGQTLMGATPQYITISDKAVKGKSEAMKIAATGSGASSSNDSGSHSKNGSNASTKSIRIEKPIDVKASNSPDINLPSSGSFSGRRLMHRHPLPPVISTTPYTSTSQRSHSFSVNVASAPLVQPGAGKTPKAAGMFSPCLGREDLATTTKPDALAVFTQQLTPAQVMSGPSHVGSPSPAGMPVSGPALQWCWVAIWMCPDGLHLVGYNASDYAWMALEKRVSKALDVRAIADNRNKLPRATS